MMQNNDPYLTHTESITDDKLSEANNVTYLDLIKNINTNKLLKENNVAYENIPVPPEYLTIYLYIADLYNSDCYELNVPNIIDMLNGKNPKVDSVPQLLYANVIQIVLEDFFKIIIDKDHCNINTYEDLEIFDSLLLLNKRIFLSILYMLYYNIVSIVEIYDNLKYNEIELCNFLKTKLFITCLEKATRNINDYAVNKLLANTVTAIPDNIHIITVKNPEINITYDLFSDGIESKTGKTLGECFTYDKNNQSLKNNTPLDYFYRSDITLTCDITKQIKDLVKNIVINQNGIDYSDVRVDMQSLTIHLNLLLNNTTVAPYNEQFVKDCIIPRVYNNMYVDQARYILESYYKWIRIELKAFGIKIGTIIVKFYMYPYRFDKIYKIDYKTSNKTASSNASVQNSSILHYMTIGDLSELGVTLIATASFCNSEDIYNTDGLFVNSNYHASLSKKLLGKYESTDFFQLFINTDDYLKDEHQVDTKLQIKNNNSMHQECDICFSAVYNTQEKKITKMLDLHDLSKKLWRDVFDQNNEGIQ